MKTCALLVYFFFIFNIVIIAQPVPAEVENIPFLMTFGPKADKSWGDDLYPQIFFFLFRKILRALFT